MPVILPFALMLAPQSYDPEIEAILRRPRQEKAQPAPAPPPPPVNQSADAPTDANTPSLPVPPEIAGPFQACLDTAIDSPDAGIAAANEWRLKGGGFYARHCLGFAYARAERWAPAMVAFQQAAEEAERAGAMPQSAQLWAQAGNAALAGGEAAKARDHFDAALARGLPDGLVKGEVQLDRARALVALDDLTGARDSIDAALDQAPRDPLGWLLSATLARRTGEMALAQAHIARAVQLSPDDAAVALEEGNIAILTDHEDIARAAWQRAVRLAPASAEGRAAADNLSRLPAATPVN